MKKYILSNAELSASLEENTISNQFEPMADNGDVSDSEIIILQVTDNRFRKVSAAKEFINDKSVMDVIKSDVFAYMNTAYKYEDGGFLSFTGEDDKV